MWAGVQTSWITKLSNFLGKGDVQINRVFELVESLWYIIYHNTSKIYT